MKRSSNAAESYSVDTLMRNTAFSLLRDFQSSGALDPGEFSSLMNDLKGSNIKVIRSHEIDKSGELTVTRFKALYQVESLLKRYRFENDLYSDDELIEKAITGFCDTQNRLKQLDLNSLAEDSQRVLDLAKEYIHTTLGGYDADEHRRLCRFGRKASVGVSAKLACEAQRWEVPISGSSDQISWFRSEMDEVPAVQDYLHRQIVEDPSRSFYQETDSLRLTLVPKTFKAFRSIMPNTTIGSYMSFGLGEMIRRRLQRRGYDIRTLQEEHKVLAQDASRRGHLVTADLSSASDCITVSLLERLLPADWLDILNQSRIGKVELPNGQLVESLTYCTMGIGYTFPLQTLVFLSLLKAIQATMKYRKNGVRRISVYGDDMIYPLNMHTNVCSYFEQFGFVINIDKTFHEGNFRESCGGDYYCGTDVRPFQPRSGTAIIRKKKPYEAVLYKLINGLLRRWSEHEIRGTLDYLVSEVLSLETAIKRVPGDYPDDAGIRCWKLGCHDFLQPDFCAKLKSVGHGLFRFSFLGLKPEERKEVRHEPYYWLALRSPPDFNDHTDRESGELAPVPRCAREFNERLGIRDGVSSLITREDDPVVTIRSKISGRRLRRTSTYVTVGHTGRYTRQSGTSCFEDRR